MFRNKENEASFLGTVFIAGRGNNVFTSFDDANDFMVNKEITITTGLSKKAFFCFK